MKQLNLFAVIAIFFAIAFFNTTVFGQAAKYKGWKAGVSREVITPSEAIWMAGYGGRDRPAEGKLADLWCKTLVLEDENGKQVVLVTTDLLGFPKKVSDQIRDQLKTKFNLSRAQIILNASHTHSGPVLSHALVSIYPVNSAQQKQIDEYSVKLIEKIVKMVGESLKRMQPVHIYAGNGATRFQVNRRNNNESVLSRQTELSGPNDYAVPVLKVVDLKGKLLAIAFGYACHNTVLSGYKWSGDYAGFAQSDLEKIYPGTTALFFQGCGANLNPLPRRTEALAQQYGTELSAAVVTVLAEEMRQLTPQLNAAYSEIQLPLSTPPTRSELTKFAEKATGYEKRWANNLLKKIESGESLITAYPYPVQVWKLGDQPIISLGGEVVVEYAIQLKQIFGQDIFVLGYSNDVMGYIPNAAILREGGYEGASSQMVYGLPSKWKANIEALIIGEVLRLAKEAQVPILD